MQGGIDTESADGRVRVLGRRLAEISTLRPGSGDAPIIAVDGSVFMTVEPMSCRQANLPIIDVTAPASASAV